MAIKKIDQCRTCGKPKSAETFDTYVAKAGPDVGKRVLRAKCRDCTAAYKKDWVARNPESVRRAAAADYRRAKQRNPNLNRERDLRRNYGMTPAEYDLICESQGGVCAACHQPPSGGRWLPPRLVVDHCHRSGQVRELLCGPCNSALGLIGDSLERLRQLVAYLERH